MATGAKVLHRAAVYSQQLVDLRCVADIFGATMSMRDSIFHPADTAFRTAERVMDKERPLGDSFGLSIKRKTAEPMSRTVLHI